jgi:prolyl-tRNA editing enzyme YbaK/EbsC (Cys-tRNA(Pro) deacylase)
MDKKIQKFLETEGVKFEAIKHRKVYTAFNAAETQHISPKEVVKTVLIKFDKPLAFVTEPEDKVEKYSLSLIAIPAGKHLDFKKIDKFIFDTQTKLYKKLVKKNPKLAKPLKVKTSVAKEKDIAGKLNTKYLLAPLEIYGLPLFLDKKLTLNKNIVFSAGSFTESVKIPTKQYLQAVNPILGAFAK